eukprot:TRINITY_DN70574_c0_g1_i1.p1 TRINITY_DN70574_c0_g1~~TRINITY_DN70574_c0_g1_i1.p1  ORF type:complete len:270 (-),score=45.55 TRINITY_DN70574_c0_g1_i1:4-813(-)
MGFFSKLFSFGSKGSLSSFGKAYTLTTRTPIARNTHRFTFALETPEAVLGLPVGHHLEVRLPNSGGVSRAYTPTTGDATKGSFDLVVKVYPDGQVTPYLDSLKVGDTAEIAGPSGEITYKGAGSFEIEDPFEGSKRLVQCDSVGMIAGGTGITPMYQIAAYSAAAEADKMEMSLLFCNREPDDVMLQSELDGLAADCGRFRVTYAVDSAGASWDHETGQISKPLIETAMAKLAKRPDLMCICGPPGFHRAAKAILMDELGYSRNDIFEF